MLTKLRSISREVVPVHLYGNVSIDPSAVIAPGVLLQAEGSSQIKIGAGVCIGAGTIVHAAGGNIYIEAGVCLGRGVLIIGSGSIDRDACIGAGTTAIDPVIAAGEVIPTHSLLGDRSRGEVSVVENDEQLPEHLNVSPPPATDTSPAQDRDADDVWGDRPVEPSTATTPPASSTPNPTATGYEGQSDPNPSTATGTSPPSVPNHPVSTAEIVERKSSTYVAGRAQFDRMKRALFAASGDRDDTTST
jgi:carbon dioxide concentrating mechanism protein CcmN